MTALINNKNIAIIGAGASGLCAAKYLAETGLRVSIFEIGTNIGGLWCFMNDNGCLPGNAPRYFVRFLIVLLTCCRLFPTTGF